MTESRVCLVESKIWWIENNGEKIEEKIGLCVVWYGGKERKFLGGARHFSPRPTQNLPLQNGEKIRVEMSVERKRQK